ncbi:MAG: endonuclease/exonuclease/phosphatase family protein [Deltaproteobacteria bacterium]|jgi:endonuclease/exonuclease/phosphatase family metal-dependent hydrolase|nr:endonuclease/exonuclease/phosphatase family protein [Deltaproteobacteria bacterium]MBW2520503.1 endonuclease/exonuclease/phosphatase family protein [Deltaproteobacteria bacterium]
MTTARIMTYNIQRCCGSDGQANPDRIMNVIADSAPDVVAIQEVGSVNHADVLPYMADALGLDFYRDLAGGSAAFLSFYPLKGVQQHDLGYGGYCLRGDLELSGKRMHLLNVCLDSYPRFRSFQINRLLGPELLGNPSLGCPMLILGDFADFFWGAGNLQLAATLRRTRRPLWRGTYPARIPLFGRDRAYLRGGLRILDASINHTYLARQASNHLPLTLTVQITDTRRSVRLTKIAGGRMEAAPG